MPATSRAGGAGLRRSGSGRAGSPSKSISDQNPSGERSVCPRWRSPCTRCWAQPLPRTPRSVTASNAARSPGTYGTRAGTARAASSSRRVIPATSCRVWVPRSAGVGSAAASAVCTSAVARPSASASGRKSRPAASAARASRHPSRAPCRNGWSTPRVSGPAPGASNQATGAGTRSHPSRARASGSSRSGLAPGKTRRKILRMYASP